MTKTWTLLGLALALSLGWTGCAGPGSCTMTASTPMSGVTCTDYGDGYSSNYAMATCVAPNQYATAPCTTASRVGHCTVSVAAVDGTTSNSIVSYYPPTTTVAAMSNCAALGMMGGTVATFAAN